jgi:sarcosine oxidase subunit gamma
MSEARTQLRTLAAGGVAVVEQPVNCALSLRGDPADARFVRAVESVTDLRLPGAAGAMASGLLASILCLGPDEWLVLSETQPGPALLASLRKALGGLAAAITDVGDARVVYAVSGSNARALLAKGCGLDLHERTFAPGRCAQSVLAKVPVILVHRSGVPPVFDLYVARSFRDYAWDWLQAAALEYATAADARNAGA